MFNSDICCDFPVCEMHEFQRDLPGSGSFVILGTQVKEKQRTYELNKDRKKRKKQREREREREVDVKEKGPCVTIVIDLLSQATESQAAHYGCIVKNSKTHEV